MLYSEIEIPVGSLGTVTLRSYCPQCDPAWPAAYRRPAAVICPGGGYRRRDFNEDEPAALALAAEGINAFIVDYHVAPSRFPRPQQDAGAAVHYLRTHAEEYRLDPQHVCVMGFSSGGHLAASLGVTGQYPEIWQEIGLDWKKDVRPDTLVLCYPVITAGRYAHRDSFSRLTGSENPADHSPLSLEKLVTPETPRTFLWHTWEDKIVPVQNSLLFASALAEHGIEAEVHLYPKGPHGIGLASDAAAHPELQQHMIVPDVQDWFRRAVRFIKQ